MGSHWLQMALIWTLGSEWRASRAPIFNPKEVTILSILSLSLQQTYKIGGGGGHTQIQRSHEEQEFNII